MTGGQVNCAHDREDISDDAFYWVREACWQAAILRGHTLDHVYGWKSLRVITTCTEPQFTASWTGQVVESGVLRSAN